MKRSALVARRGLSFLYDTPGRQLACLHELPAVSRQTGKAVFPVMIKIREGEEEDERADQTSEKGIEV